MIRTAFLLFLALVLGVSARADTLRLAVTALPIGLGNPYRSTGVPGIFLMSAMFDALTNIGSDGQPQPWLAARWEAETPTRWVFHLRRDVTFANGRPFDAAAVVAAVTYLTSPAAATDLVSSEFDNVAGATARDAYTVVFALRRPDALFARTVSMLFIVEPEIWAARGRDGFAKEPVGTGPFQLTSWRRTGADLRAVPASWRAPQVDGLEVSALPDATARVQGMLSGRLDLAMVLGPDDGPTLAASGHTLLVYPVGGVMGFAFTATRATSPVSDVRVRRALNYAVDKQRIIDALLGGRSVAAGQPVTRATFGYNPDLPPYPYDPAKARALLAEAGHGNGLTLVAEVVPGTMAADAQIFAQVAAYLAQVGVTLNLRVTTFPTFSRHYRQGDWEGDAHGMYYNADPYLDALRAIRLHSCAWEKPWYCDREATPLIEAALTASTEAERLARTRAVMARYHDQASGLFLHELSGYMGVAKRVQGFRIAQNFMYLEQVRLGSK